MSNLYEKVGGIVVWVAVDGGDGERRSLRGVEKTQAYLSSHVTCDIDDTVMILSSLDASP